MTTLISPSPLEKHHHLPASLLAHRAPVTFPRCLLQICAYVNKFSQSENHDWDLLALRFLSINPIIDPWVFAILRPPVLRVLRSVLCCQLSPCRQDAQCSTPAKTKLEPGGQ